MNITAVKHLVDHLLHTTVLTLVAAVTLKLALGVV
jgi:hypothetical protein